MGDIDISLVVIVSNTLVVFATFVATLYRIKIERDQIRTFKQNITSNQCLESFRKYVKAERSSIVSMDRTELEKFVDYLEKLGED
jgi:RNA polymerase-interacting CarD/CdnL/TRCF family regulator